MVKINLSATTEEILAEVEAELARAIRINGHFLSKWEAFGALTEEFYEVVEAFHKSTENAPERNTDLHIELVQLAAMCRKWAVSEMQVVSWKPDGSEKTRKTMEALGYIASAYHGLASAFDQERGIGFHLEKIHDGCVAAIMWLCTIRRLEPGDRTGECGVYRFEGP